MLARPDPRAVDDAWALLERAVDYTRVNLTLVSTAALDRGTPCGGWTVRELLRHMDDSLEAFTDAAEIGYVATMPTHRTWSREDPGEDPATVLTGRLRDRACDLLGAWTSGLDRERVHVGDRTIGSGRLIGAGALEIAVHGWDLARGCGASRPLPEELARDLLAVASLLLREEDRPGRFADPVAVPEAASPGARLLGYLGRRD